MPSREAALIKYLFEKKEIRLPSAIFKNKLLLELDKAFRVGQPIAVSNLFKKVAKNLDEYLDSEELESFFKLVHEFKKECKRKGKLTEDDEKILRFLVKESMIKMEDFLEIFGSLYFILKIAEDLEKEKIRSKTLKMFILISSYVQLYELILYEVDRRIYFYLRRTYLKKKEYEQFLKLERKYTKHATAGMINKVLSSILKIDETNKSIFGKSSKPKIIRNRISHGNIFYDENSDKIIVEKDEYSTKDFMIEFYKLVAFGIRWLEFSTGIEKDHTNYIDSIKHNLRNAYFELSNLFLKVERNTELKRAFQSWIIRLKEETELV